LRNYLLDRHFQLKYASYVAGVALLISGALGALLWRASEEIIEQSHASVRLGEEVLSESRKVSEVVAMNIVKDPVYNDNPALKAAFEADAQRQADKQSEQQSRLETQAAQLQTQRARFASLLLGALVVLVVALWLAGIVVTHRVAGPIYKMKRQLRALEKGSLEVPMPLRKGDELKEFFDAFNDTVKALRARQQADLDRLSAALERLEPSVPPAELEPLRQLRSQMQATLGPGSTRPSSVG
jgi:nitrogen fixation/metabolism regulation signal transduction histidine kinase